MLRFVLGRRLSQRPLPWQSHFFDLGNGSIYNAERSAAPIGNWTSSMGNTGAVDAHFYSGTKWKRVSPLPSIFSFRRAAVGHDDDDKDGVSQHKSIRHISNDTRTVLNSRLNVIGHSPVSAPSLDHDTMSTALEKGVTLGLNVSPNAIPTTAPTASPSAIAQYLDTYATLSKSRLAALVVLTTMAGYAMAPLTCSVSPSSLLWTTVGTALCVSSANSFNQWMEVPYDAQMQRTRNRPLVQHRVSSLHAFTFAVLSGVVGVGTLYQLVNPLTAALGCSNILLYAGIYTPWKRRSPLNTWIGSLVGGIPPAMGWAAVTNHLDGGCWLMAAALFAWQFPHFHALSWNIRDDYARAGYRMLACTDPKGNALISLVASLSLFPICFGMTAIGVTSPCFVATSSVVNGAMAYWAWRFYRENTSDSTARKLFRTSLFHLPLLVMLMLIHKRNWPHAEERRNGSLHQALHGPFGVYSESDSIDEQEVAKYPR